ncbi:glutamyl-tRNA reductase [Thermoanaerobacterium sp. RBIITD]|uniref:glutamyl-tRNA reductase n=1 Tax=Thermoanaerobacterium sp. RBIITD TaxID=1550240 RepID=UPI000BB8F765|nr:glutamyl-tRNA reductase [Thermoanaerobacterium sp. RBIITD]SNX55193.1 glutamyl-tRNA reductase [Thermoanaerobacterium sp. RBIITD]
MNINDIKMVGIDQNTPIEIRERVSFGKEIKKALLKFKETYNAEVVILSTCHRSEIYVYSENIALKTIKDFFIEYFKVTEDELGQYLYILTGVDAVKHIFRVACGLESMVVGEDQILGQVKNAISISQENFASGKILNKLFRDAITLGKKVRTETGIKDLALSISYIAVKFISDEFKDLNDKKAFVIGTGEMGQIAIKNLISKGTKVYVSNRTHSKAVDLKKIIPEIEVVPYDDKYVQIARSDIVISATDAPHYTIDYEKFIKVYKGKKICMVDIALPRDIDPKIGEIEGVSIYTLDDLKKTADENKKKRIGFINVIEKIIESAVNNFVNWFKTLAIEPQIKNINKFADVISEIEFERVINKLSNIDERDKKNIEIALKRVAKKMSDLMIKHIKNDIINKKYEEVAIDFIDENGGNI